MSRSWKQVRIVIAKDTARHQLNRCLKHKRSLSISPGIRRVKKTKVQKPGGAAAARRSRVKALGALRDEGYESCSGRIESTAVGPALIPSSKCDECLHAGVSRLMEQIYAELNDVSNRTNNVGEDDHLRHEALSHELQVSRVVTSAVAFTDKPHDPLKSIVWNVTDGELKSDIKPFTCKRYGALAFLNKWPLLSVLAHSETFRDAALTLSSTYWDELIQYAVRNDTSLQVFGKVRGLDLISALEPLLVHMRPRHRAACIDLIHDIRGNPSLQMDHAYVIADSIDQVRRPVFEGKYQVHIDENLYSHEIFTEEGEPEIWLTGIPYPGNPMLRLPNRSTCVLCWKKSSCNCNMSKSERVLRPLVELHQCPDKGVGVRALEHIPAGMILDEYVGEIRCGDYNGDPAYAFAVKRYGKQIEQDIAVISSKEYGNWTRFINHSCDPSTEFKEYTLGDRYRVVVTSVRNIRMFEEILIHYGEGYWQNKKCLCGESNCVTKKAKAEAAEETKKLQTQAEDLFEKC